MSSLEAACQFSDPVAFPTKVAVERMGHQRVPSDRNHLKLYDFLPYSGSRIPSALRRLVQTHIGVCGGLEVHMLTLIGRKHKPCAPLVRLSAASQAVRTSCHETALILPVLRDV